MKIPAAPKKILKTEYYWEAIEALKQIGNRAGYAQGLDKDLMIIDRSWIEKAKQIVAKSESLK